jgi:Rad3-related DNA helicase
MASLHTKIKLYLEANSKTEAELYSDNIELQNDGSGNYIKVWNVSGLAQPTDEQLNALESQADELEALNQVYANRQSEYPSIQDLVVALYDTEDKAAIDSKRAEIKLKHPKP